MSIEPAQLERLAAREASADGVSGMGVSGMGVSKMGVSDEPPGILQLAWPAIAGNLAMSVVGIVDIKIVGSLGAEAVAAVTTGHRMFWILQAVLIAITAGTTAMVARAWGAGDRLEAARVTKASLVVCVALALAFTLPAVLFAEQLAGIFKLDPETLAQAARFIRMISLFNAGFAIAMVIGASLRAAGDTLTPLAIGLITNVVNIFLVYGLVYGRFGLPAMGVVGAALASGLAFSVGALISVVLWMRGWLRIGFQADAWLTAKRVRQLFDIGYPAGLEQAAMQLGFIIFLWIVSNYGTAPYAAYGIGVQLLSFSFVVAFGFTIAASTHVGQRLGARDPEGAAHSGWSAVRYAIVTMVVLGGVVVAFAEPLARFMIADPEVVRLTVIFIYILGAVQPLMAIDFTLGGALRGAGDTRFPLFTTLTGLVFVRGTIAAFFAWRGFPVEWIFGALIFDYMVKSSLLAWRFRSGRWQHIEI
ncbi:MAG: MATE family efflux transporter [Deltaproteobacteria bacterium]|nr:MATE family efflux transporter [Deltaproteobacteria bacterium]